MNPIDAFEYLLADRQGWLALRKSLYHAAPFGWASAAHLNGTSLSSSMYALAIAAVLLAWIDSSRAIHVVTYNLDSLLEEMIASLGHHAVSVVGSREKNWPPETCSYLVADTRIPRRSAASVYVYHPHGMILREQDSLTDELGWKGNRISVARRSVRLPDGIRLPVMCTSQYRELRDKPLGERNLIQLHSLARDRILFYGFSLTDPNVDYLIDLAARIEGGSYSWSDQDPPRPAAELRHVALLISGKGREVPLPVADDEVPAPEVLKGRRLSERGIRPYGSWSFDQHHVFILELLREINREHRFVWPGHPLFDRYRP